MNIRFCARLLKSATEAYETLKHVYGSNTLSRTQAFEWHRRFIIGRESVEDDESFVYPQTSHTAKNVENVFAAVLKSRLQTIAQIAETGGICDYH
ncbi:hypothetical protein TNCV_4022971 [Trichonephila clavipes]|nr:hypothetical protein TNCV_4022971 [Trichonephila clavipes]